MTYVSPSYSRRLERDGSKHVAYHDESEENFAKAVVIGRKLTPVACICSGAEPQLIKDSEPQILNRRAELEIA